MAFIFFYMLFLYPEIIARDMHFYNLKNTINLLKGDFSAVFPLNRSLQMVGSGEHGG